MLTGEYINKMDDKGRVMIPAKLRSALSSTHLVITKSFDNTKCISLFVADDFEKTVNNAFMGTDGLQLFNPDVMRLARRFVATAQAIEFDSAGRVLLPQSIRSYAGISPKDEVMVVGVTNHIELWNKAEYDEYMNADIDYTKLAAELSRNGRSQ